MDFVFVNHTAYSVKVLIHIHLTKFNELMIIDVLALNPLFDWEVLSIGLLVNKDEVIF